MELLRTRDPVIPLKAACSCETKPWLPRGAPDHPNHAALPAMTNLTEVARSRQPIFHLITAVVAACLPQHHDARLSTLYAASRASPCPMDQGFGTA